jgi:hypothetical protein
VQPGHEAPDLLGSGLGETYLHRLTLVTGFHPVTLSHPISEVEKRDKRYNLPSPHLLCPGFLLSLPSLGNVDSVGSTGPLMWLLGSAPLPSCLL